MPITGPSSYPATIEEFLSHWEDVNDLLGAGSPLVLPDGMTRADLVTWQETLDAQRDHVSDYAVDRSLARVALNQKISALLGRMVEFNSRVRGDLSGNPIAGVLEAAFSVGDGESVVRDALRKTSRLWELVNAISPAPSGVTLPMLLSGSYSRANFDTDRDALRTAYRTLSEAEVDGLLARSQRNQYQDTIYAMLLAYRAKITGMKTAHPDFVESLPRLTPAAGSTPNAVTANAQWDATASQAKITWTASTETDLQKYEVRGVAGDDYQTDDETVLATILPDAPREFMTDFALTSAGLEAGFKVYVILHTGNERGSNAVHVTRPG